MKLCIPDMDRMEVEALVSIYCKHKNLPYDVVNRAEVYKKIFSTGSIILLKEANKKKECPQ